MLAPKPSRGRLIGKDQIKAHWGAGRAASAVANDNPRLQTVEACEADVKRRLMILSPRRDMTAPEHMAAMMLLERCNNCHACVFARFRTDIAGYR